jgi:hypothetical protein
MGKNKDKPKPSGEADGDSKPWAALIGGVFVVLAACVTGGFALWNTVIARNGATQITAGISIEIFRLHDSGSGSSGSPIRQSLASGLPFDAAGNLNLQIWVTAPASERPTLIWIDTEGKAQQFALKESEELDTRRRYIWPAPNKFGKVEGPAGTEVILACSKAGTPPSLRDLSLDTPTTPWPAPPSTAILNFNNADVKLDDLRGPAKSPPSKADYLERVRELQNQLAGRGIKVAGIAFARTTSPSKP